MAAAIGIAETGGTAGGTSGNGGGGGGATTFFSQQLSQLQVVQKNLYSFREDHCVFDRLQYFLRIRKIPNIIFHGSSGCGKKTIVYQFVQQIYGGDRSKIKNHVMYVNCAHGKGIKFIRDELKFFAKTNLLQDSLVQFKSIVLFNADELTTDAQSALRRCIEVFSSTTRFFIVVENKSKLLNPILSRFCEIYIPDKDEAVAALFPVLAASGRHSLNLHTLQQHLVYALDQSDPYHVFGGQEAKQRFDTTMKPWILQRFGVCQPKNDDDMVLPPTPTPTPTHTMFVEFANDLYEDGVIALDLLRYCEWLETTINHTETNFTSDQQRDYARWNYENFMMYQRIRVEFRCEKLLMFTMLDHMFLKSDRRMQAVIFL